MSSGRYNRNGSSRTSNAWTTQNRRSNADRYGADYSRDESHSRDRGSSGGGYTRQKGTREGRYFGERGSRDDRFSSPSDRNYRSDIDSRYESSSRHARAAYKNSKDAVSDRYVQDHLNSDFRSLNIGTNQSSGRQVSGPKENRTNIAARKQSPMNGRGAYVPPHIRARRKQQPNISTAKKDSEPSRPSVRMATTAAPARSAPAHSGSNKSRWVERPRMGGPTGANDCCLFFGDSFVGCFSLLPPKPNLILKKFKGATAKGLTRDTNENRQFVLGTVARLYEKRARRPVNQAVFVFGNVDVHMSYYYCRYHKKKSIDFEAIAKSYVAFVAGIPHVQEKIVVGVFPSSWQDKHVRQSLAVYRAILDEDKPLIPDHDCLLAERQKRVLQFNRVLKQECARHGSVTYTDVYDKLVDPDTQQVRPRFLDESLYNVHFIWETTLLLWLDKFKWLVHHVPRTFRDSLTKSLDDYRRSKCEELKEKAAERAAERENVKQLLKCAREAVLTRKMFEDLGIETDTWSDDEWQKIQSAVSLDSTLRTAAMLQSCINTIVPPDEDAVVHIPKRN